MRLGLKTTKHGFSSAWAVDLGISLGQLATEEKSNEITAISQLLEQIDVEKAVVTIDAAGCQRDIAKQIIRQSESGGQLSTEVRFYICSIGMGVKQFARYVRGHWAIENTLHWCLDVTFREDENRVRNRRAESPCRGRGRVQF